MRRPEQTFWYSVLTGVLAVALIACASEGGVPVQVNAAETPTPTPTAMPIETPEYMIPADETWVVAHEPWLAEPAETPTPLVWPRLEVTSQPWYALEREQVFVPKMVGYDSEGNYNDGLYHVAQQPSDNPVFVSYQDDVLTQFKMAADHGTIALLAHNYLQTGAMIAELSEGDGIVLYRPDGATNEYVIKVILQLWAESPTSVTSNFVPADEVTAEYMDNHVVDDPHDDIYTAAQVFLAVFETKGEEQPGVTLQTCIGRDENGDGDVSDAGEPSAGRVFVLAEPVGEP